MNKYQKIPLLSFMKMNRFKIVKTSVAALTAAAFLCAGFQSANAAVVALYNFTGSVSTSSDTELNSTANTLGNAGITVGYSVGIGNPAPSRTVDGGSTLATQQLTDYFSFTVTPNSGYYLHLNGFTLTFDALNADPGGGIQTANWAVRTSVLGFTGVNVAAGTFTEAGWTTQTTTFTGAAYDNRETAVEFRIYMWDPNGSSTMYFDNITLNANVVPVPEPINVALGVFGLCAVGFAAGRRYLRKRA